MTGKFTTYKEQLALEVKTIPNEYLPHPIQIYTIFRNAVTLGPARENFQKAWQEAAAGYTRPVSKLWNGINADEFEFILAGRIHSRIQADEH